MSKTLLYIKHIPHTVFAMILLAGAVCGNVCAQDIDHSVLQKVYDEVATPYKYGMVVAPEDNKHKIDCPMVYRYDGKWYMTYVNYNGKDGIDGRGYETWLAESDDLLHWNTLGRVLAYPESGWDLNQRAGYPALIDWNWGGTYEMAKYNGRYWMSYFGGEGTGYEAVKAPLSIGMASTKGRVSVAHQWECGNQPVLAITDGDVQWWEKLTHYKPTVYLDQQKSLGHKFVMFYNAGGINPVNNLKAERIGIALSDDMVKWKRYGGNPVFSHEAPGIITGDAQVVKMPAGFGGTAAKLPLYVMFYFSAYSPTRKYDAYNTFAVSRDLVHWQDWDGQDLVYPSKPYDEKFAHKSYVMKHDGVVYHFYCAVNNAGQRGIAVATSQPMGKSDVAFPQPDKKGRRTETSLDKQWTVEFRKTNADSITAAINPFNVDVPNNLDDYYGYRQLKHGNLHGEAMYTKQFHAEKKTGKRYFLQFEGIGTYATVTLNGTTYAKELVGRTSYTLDITDALLSGNNTLQVLVDHPAMQTASPWVCGGCSSEWGFSEGSQPFGIFRPVTMIETDEVRIEPFGVHVWNNAACDSVFIETEVKNYGAAEATLQLVSKMNLSSGKTFFRLSQSLTLRPGETATVCQSAAVSDVHLWSQSAPYLYSLATMIKRDGKTTDEVTTPYGIRSVSWPVHRKDGDNRFLLNGSPVFINGTCEYEHLFGQSHAFSHEQIASRVKQVRQAGFNAFREAHQPHNLYYQKLFDEQGILFWSQFSAHIWYDSPDFRDSFKRLLRRWVKERRNSPSVILWGLQNESVMPKDFTEECSQIIREMDPTAIDQRAITTCNGGDGADWNVIQNWSGTYGGTADRYGEELKQPSQLLNGEYGAWRTMGLHGNPMQDETTTSKTKHYTEEAFVNLLSKKALLAESVKDSICGHFQWIFVSHENPGRVQPDESVRRIDKVGPFNYKGLLSPWEQPTAAFYWYRNHYASSRVDSVTPTAADRNKNILQPAAGYHYLVRVNCGGDSYTDTYGNTWMQDYDGISHSWSERFGLNPYMASQGTIADSIHGTRNQQLFKTFRWGRHALGYDILLENGDYRVELYFAEPWYGAHYGAAIDCEGERIFDVAVNGHVVIDDLDPWAEGGYAGAVKKVVDAKVEDGHLTVTFPEVKAGQAIISAIAIASKDTKSQPVLQPDTLPADYWSRIDRDTLEKCPKQMLPQDKEAFPAVRYTETKAHEWQIQPGVARQYMMRFRYKNVSGSPIVARLRITDSNGTVMQDRDMTFPVTPNKFKTIGTTTDTQINAGVYRVVVETKRPLDFQYLEIQ